MLRSRLLAAAAILTPLLALFVADYRWNGGAPGIWLVIPGLAVGLLATAELLDLLRAAGARPLAWTAYLGTSLVFLAACAPMIWAWQGAKFPLDDALSRLGLVFLVGAAAVALAFVGEMRRFESPGGAATNLATAIFVVVYVGVPLGFAAALRQFHDNAWGMAALVSVVFVVKLSDTGAYFVGKTWGRHKLAPNLSPGKTVEGGVGGLLAAVIASLLFFGFVAPWLTKDAAFHQSLVGAAIYGLVLAIVALIGDLGESLLKRDAQRKDSSRWLPGLGGVLDVMDSLLFAVPAAYVCWATGLVGPK